MLSCIIGKKSINSFDYEESKLREWSNKEILKCPECGERVIYCNGDYKIPYFKHEVGSECEGNKYYEPMTSEHIDGIRALYERLKCIDGIENLEVEKYIQNTKQRPDIYFEYKDKRYCIEYQCSPISTQYNKRHELYQLEDINDIWILGTEKYGFVDFENNENGIEFEEKKVKTIEDEIDRSSSPLMYLKDDVVYKVDDFGFKPVIRYNPWKRFNENYILKKTFNVNLLSYPINELSVSDITCKLNLDYMEIYKSTRKTIEKCENLVIKLKEYTDGYVGFKYDLSIYRFPIYRFYYDHMELKECCDIEFDSIDVVYDKIVNVNNSIDRLNKLLDGLNEKYKKYNFILIGATNYNYIHKEDYDFGKIYVKEINSNNTIYESKQIYTNEYIDYIYDILNNKFKQVLDDYIYSRNKMIKEKMANKIKGEFKNQCGNVCVYGKYKFLNSICEKINKTLSDYHCKRDYEYIRSMNGYKNVHIKSDVINITSNITNEIVYLNLKIDDKFSASNIVSNIRHSIEEHKSKVNIIKNELMFITEKINNVSFIKGLTLKMKTEEHYEVNLNIEFYDNASEINIDFENKKIKYNNNVNYFDNDFNNVFSNIIHSEIRRLRYEKI